MLGIVPLGPSAYRVVSADLVEGTIQSSRYAELHVGEGSDRTTLDALGYRKRQQAVLSLPRSQAILKWVHLPATDPAQIDKMMPHEARIHLPWPEDEGLAGHQVLETYGDGNALVLLTLVRLDLVTEHVEKLRELGIAVTHVETSTLSLVRLLAPLGGERPMGVVRIEGNSAEFLRVSDGVVAFSRASHEDEPARQMLEHAQALDRHRHGAAAECPRTLVVADDPADAEPILNQVPGATVLDAAQLPVLNGLGVLEGREATCLGAALAQVNACPAANLLPPPEMRRQAFGQLLRDLRWLLAACLWFGVAVYALGRFYIDAEADYVASTQEVVRLLQEQVGDLDTKSKQVELLQDEIESVSLPLDIVLELYERTPQTIAINHLRYDGRGSLVMSGEAPSYPAMFEYVEILHASARFTDVTVNHGAKPQTMGQALIEFKVTFRIGTQKEEG